MAMPNIFSDNTRKAPLEARTGFVMIILVSSLAFLLFQARMHIREALELQEMRLALEVMAFQSSEKETPAAAMSDDGPDSVVSPLSGSLTIVVSGSPAAIPQPELERLGLTAETFIDTRGKFVILEGWFFASIVTGDRVAITAMPLTAVAMGLLSRMAADIAGVAFLGFLMLLVRESRMSDYEVRRLLEASPVALFVLGPDGNTQFANEAALELFHGKTTATLEQFGISLKAQSEVFDWLRTTGEAGDLTEMREFCLPDGRHLAISRQFLLVRSRSTIIGSAADVTVRHAAENALLKAKEAAEALGRMKSESLAMISHELKTPVSGILGLAQLLSAEKLPNKAERIVRKMIQVGKTLTVIINDIVDLAILEVGHLRVDHVSFDPRETIATAVTLVSGTASQKGLAVRVQIDESVPKIVTGDPARLQQIIINLVGNGIKFTDAGHVEVRAGATQLREGELELLLEVEDTGIGIAPDVIPKLFQPFSQGDTGNRRRYEGTGLGLAISKRLAETMRGHISVESTPGSGATFCVTLPVARGEPKSAALLAMNSKVLVVDDVALNLQVVSGLLRARGCTVFAAASGEEAITILKEHAFDLVLMDIRMPGTDGITTTATIRTDHNLTKNAGMIVGLTASPLPTDKPLYTLRGFDDVVGKPVELDYLSRILENWPASMTTGSSYPKRIESLCRQLGAARTRRILDAFIEVTSQATETLAASCSRLDFSEVREAAHRLSGAASNIGLTELSDEAARLEEAAAAGDTIAVADNCTHVIRIVVAARPAIAAWSSGSDVTMQRDNRPHELS